MAAVYVLLGVLAVIYCGIWADNIRRERRLRAVAPMPMWTAPDIAAAFGWRSASTARKAVKRWRDAGMVQPIRRDPLTGGWLYDSREIREAHAKETTNTPEGDPSP